MKQPQYQYNAGHLTRAVHDVLKKQTPQYLYSLTRKLWLIMLVLVSVWRKNEFIRTNDGFDATRLS